MSTEGLQRVIDGAPRGATIQFAAGTYVITHDIRLPCRNLRVTGPESSPPVAVLSAAYSGGQTIFSYPDQCTDMGSILYFHFENTGALYVGAGSSNLVFEHNQVTHLPSSPGGSYAVAEAGVFLDGSVWPLTITTNVLIEDNLFGDPTSCSAVLATDKDEGGFCAGVITHTGLTHALVISHNTFEHLEQGIHFLQLASFKPGDPSSGCASCVIEYNTIDHYHRIGIEVQTYTTDTLHIEHNALVDPVGAYYGTFAVSLACCQWGPVQGVPGSSPAVVFNDNVLIASLPGQCPPYGVEFWGTGSQGTNSLIEGSFCNGYTWGYGSSPWAIRDNYICGPNFATRGGYISNQQHQNNPPIESGNVTGPTCSARSSVAPAIAPPAGSYAGAQTITLSDPGTNTSIWYTTDGSTPVPGMGTAQLYIHPFTLGGSTTLKAVGMWGAQNQPTRYPAGYGYVPSRVVSAAFVIRAAK
ncbi:MAG TPA: chitobiase/beta-hexosaminidase C-terminal domain-containing protein [Acidobacteriaceae bacterium]|jgi:hypothetical protein|nr:chitobiase/beta-hexosaminidase C-terminal domain-containing protein [Acidobacteriaceae bacterium]